MLREDLVYMQGGGGWGVGGYKGGVRGDKKDMGESGVDAGEQKGYCGG